MEKIFYKQKIKNKPPIQIKEIPSLSVNQSINLTEYFKDPEGKKLYYDLPYLENAEIRIEEETLTVLSAEKNTSSYIYVTDGEEVITSNNFYIYPRTVMIPKKIVDLLSKQEEVRIIIKTKLNSQVLSKNSDIIKTLGISEKSNLIGKKVILTKNKKPIEVKREIGELKSVIVTKDTIQDLLTMSDVDAVFVDEPFSVLTFDSVNLTRIFDVNFLGFDGSGVSVCVLDTGFSNVFGFSGSVSGYNFVDGNDDFSDFNGHGTSVVYPLITSAPGVDLIVAKVVGDSGVGFASDVLAGLDYCLDNNASVVSMSVGGGLSDGFCDDDLVAQKVNELNGLGVLVVVATGNDGSSFVRVPSCASGALPVGSSTKSFSVAGFSNFNNATLLVAPGQDILTKDLFGYDVMVSGTSMSVPFVSGVAALLLDNDSSLSSLELKDLLVHTGDLINYSGRQFVQLNAFNALMRNYTNNLTPENVYVNATTENYTLSAIDIITLINPSDGNTSVNSPVFFVSNVSGDGIINATLYTNESGSWAARETRWNGEVPWNSTGLVLLFHFNNESQFGENDTLVYDFSSLKRKNGTIVGGAKYNNSNCVFGNCISFNGSGSEVYVGNLNVTAYAYSFWLYLPYNVTSGSPCVHVYRYGTNVGQNVITLGSCSSYAISETLMISDQIGSYLRTYIRDNLEQGWHHVVINWNSTDSQYKFIVDGINRTMYVRDDNSTYNVPLNNVTNLSLNNVDINGIFNGSIDEFAIWNRSLSASEIQALYNYSRSKLYPIFQNRNYNVSDYVIWNVLAYDNASNFAWASSNYSFFVDQNPNVSISIPDNGASSYSPVFFISNVSDNQEVINATLYTNESGSFTARETRWNGEIAWNDTGLVALWHFNNESLFGENNTYAKDWSNTGHQLEIQNYTYTNGRFGLGLNATRNINGYARALRLPQSNFSGNNNFTVSLWFNSNNHLHQEYYDIFTLIDSSSSTGGYYGFKAYYDYNNGYIRAFAGNGTTRYFSGLTTEIQNNTWNHLVLTYNTTHFTLYINNVSGGAVAVIGGMVTSTENLYYYIGSNSLLSEKWNGTIDEIAIWNKYMNDTEVAVLYNYSRSRFYPLFQNRSLNNGSYIWNVLAYDNKSNAAWASSNYTFTVLNPYFLNVSLFNPLNNSFSNSRPIFECRVNSEVPIVNVSLFTNASGSWVLNLTNSSISGSSVTVRFNSSVFVQGNYSWNCFACNNYTCAFSSNNFSFFVDTVNPLISFVDPTPVDGQKNSNASNYAFINVSSSDDQGQHQIVVDWNRSLIGWWTFDNVSGNIVYDKSSYGNNGTLYNGPYQSEGYYGKSLTFDGVNDYVQGSGYNFSVFTAMAWVRTFPVSNWKGVVEFSQGTLRRGIGLNPSGFLYVVYNNNNWILNTVEVDDGQWHHIVGLYNGSSVSIYVDGVLTNLGSSSSGSSGINNIFKIGNMIFSGAAYYFNGSIDEVRIYNRVLSPQEINASYNAGLFKYYNNFTNLSSGNYSYTAYVMDRAGNVNQTSRSFTINSIPTVSNVILNATSLGNYSSDNLTLYFTQSDADGDKIYNVTDWRLNGKSIALINLPFNKNFTSSSNSTKGVIDYSSYLNNGTLGNSSVGTQPIWINNCNIGGCYFFDGINDFIDFGSVANVGFNDFSLSAWVRVKNYTPDNWGDFILGKYVVDNNRTGYLMGVRGSSDSVNVGKPFVEVGLGLNGAGGFFGNSIITDDMWHHWVLTVNRTGFAVLYIDGVNVSSKNISSSYAHNESNGFPLRLGGGILSWNDFINGSIDEVKIYNRSLSPEQVYEEFISGFNNYSLTKIVRNETSFGENWSVCITPSDLYEDGVMVCSNDIFINNKINITVLYPKTTNVHTAKNLSVLPISMNITLNDIPTIDYVLNNIYINNTECNLIYYVIDYLKVFDSFTGTDWSLITSRSTDTGNNWSKVYSTTGIDAMIYHNNSALTGSNGDSKGFIYIINESLISENYTVSYKLSKFSGDMYGGVLHIILRYIDNNNFYGLKIGYDFNKCILYKRVGGTTTTLNSSCSNYAGEGDVVSLKIYGNKLEAYWDGILQLSAIDSSLNNSGFAGFAFGAIPGYVADHLGSYSTLRIDNFNLTFNNFTIYQTYNINNTVFINCTIPNLSFGIYNFNISLNVSGEEIYAYEPNSINITNFIPLIFSSSIIPSPVAYVNDTLFGFCNASDPDDINIYYHYQWFLNGIPNASGTVGPYSQSTQINVANVSNSSLFIGQNWTLQCKADDLSSNSSALNSSVTVIVPRVPEKVVLKSPSNGNVTVRSRKPLFEWFASNHTSYYTINITSSTGCGGYYLQNVTAPTLNFTPVNDLCVNTEGPNTVYFWSVQACSPDACGNWSDTWNFSIEPYVVITLVNNNVSFGNMNVGQSKDTTTNNPMPFILQNDGNVIADLVNVSSNEPIWVSVPLDTIYYQIKARVSNETGSFNVSASVMDWINIGNNNVTLIKQLNYSDSNDSAYVDVRVEVPSAEPPGQKQSSIIFSWEQSP